MTKLDDVGEARTRRKILGLVKKRKELYDREQVLILDKANLNEQSLEVFTDTGIDSLEAPGFGQYCKVKNSGRSSLNKETLKIRLVEEGVPLAKILLLFDECTTVSVPECEFTMRFTPEKGGQ